jgi:hypothetical protein
LNNKEYGAAQRVTVKSGMFVIDSDKSLRNHFCNNDNDNNAQIGVALAKREMFDVRDNICRNKRKPKSEFEESIKRVSIDPNYRNESENVKQAMEYHIVGIRYELKRSGLSKARNKDIIRNVTVACIK